ncbi:hypothetical protein B0T10DRAFT_563827 [Thelonectria olida]|uniref:Noranthrone monooxygenase n=1 Tax=Thelonectria olida TaxID=1576542 RepID=A0A9P8W2G3_9HYPO|nr:hypothetical protein B0T10DRAFT_563827 [Thelonectria olida]
MQLTTPSLLAIATGVVGSAWSSGAIASISLVGVPGALLASSSASTVWAEFFARGISIMPKLAATTAAGYLYAAYDARERGANWKGFVAGAALTVAIVPYTQIFMSGTNALLHAAAHGTSGASLDEVKALVGKWASLNLVRSFFPLAGAAAGLATLFQNIL